ncbi:MAG: response regulator transcription factor [Spirochaetales bacterium]|nr:MAG: response regulator transcription factor [Spirochaetales bacterium]
MRLLIIEDDEQIAGFVIKGLKQAGYAVDHASDGNEGLAMAETTPYDALIIDIMLPGRDGYSIIRSLRQKGTATPVLILSALGSLDDKLEGFKAGTDDYLTKPFSFAELQARLLALLKRFARGQGQNSLQAGGLSMDLLGRRVSRGGMEIELQPREFALLEYLMRNAGNVVSKTMIMEHVWDYHFDPQTNVVDVLVHRLRSKIDKDFPDKLIHTVRGVGYVLKVT